jgi:hypothetical protein
MWVYEIDGERIPAGVYLYFQQQAYSSAYQQLTADSASEETSGTSSYLAGNISKQQIDGKDAVTWVQEETLRLCKRYIMAKKDFVALGLSVDDAQMQSQMSDTTKNYNSYEDESKMYSTYGIGLESLKAVSASDLYLSVLFYKYYDKGGEFEVSDDELIKYFEENYASAIIYQVPSPPEGSSAEGYSSDTDTKIDKFVEDLNSGADFVETLAAFEENYPEESRMAQYVTSADDFRGIIAKDGSNGEPEELITAVFNEEGYDKYVRANIGEYIYIFAKKDAHGIDEDEWYSMSLQFLPNMKYDDFNDQLDKKAVSLSVTLNNKALNRYTFKALEKVIRKFQ